MPYEPSLREILIKC